MGSQQQDAETLEARVATLEAAAVASREQDAVLATLLAYCRSIDLGREADWVDCFTADGVFDVRSHLERFVPMRRTGRAELEAFVAAHSRPPDVFHKHVYLMPDIRIDGATAAATGYFVHLVDLDGEAVIQSYGRYLDTLESCEDGRWRLVERIAHVEAASRRRP